MPEPKKSNEEGKQRKTASWVEQWFKFFKNWMESLSLCLKKSRRERLEPSDKIFLSAVSVLVAAGTCVCAHTGCVCALLRKWPLFFCSHHGNYWAYASLHTPNSREKKHTRNTQKLEPCRCRTSYVKVRGGKEEEGEGVGVGEGGGGAVGNDRQTNDK